MYENLWSPFDPKWYQEAFDRFTSTADMLFNQEDIINAGYMIPDADGSRSSVFRNQAVLNNSFDEKILRESLKDIYLNSSHRLVASNHDNVHFLKWEGHLSDMTLNASTNECEFRIPWNMFISQKDRDAFKLSQFYRKWIKVEDLLKNWKIFKCHLLVFINQKVFSEYELYIDEQEIKIRFPQIDYWIRQNYPIYIYKFDTNWQDRVRITRELITNQWNWKVPIDYIDSGIKNYSKVIVAFNKIRNTSIRSDGQTRIEILGDNLEFLDVKDGSIDLSTISQKNRIYLQSEIHEWMWMSIFVPKFFHEYPILLPVDTVHRPYQPSLYKVMTLQGVTANEVKIYRDDINEEDVKQVYIDMKGDILEEHDGWHQMIRPIVLSDAFEDPEHEPYDNLFEEFRGIRDASVSMSEMVEDFLFYSKYETITDIDWKNKVESFMTEMERMHDSYNSFYTKRRASLNRVFITIYEQRFKPMIADLLENGISSIWVNPEPGQRETIFTISSELINTVKDLVAKYYTIEILRGMLRRHLWSDPKEFIGKVRFQRPIEENNFWIFEYDVDDLVWRPAPSMTVTRHFPDVYLFNQKKETIPNKIYKAFIFYSDTMDVLNETRPIERATPVWDDEIIKFHTEQGAVYRDIFMEKFYWMGICSIYKGMLMTNQRWEVLEYIIDNPSYQRFNELFLQTMDPYFKLGLATYLKSSHYEFPFDDAIDKFQESINSNWNDFKRITNFEVYLNKQWIPSYFDYITKIMDKWRWEERYIARPPASFDILRLLPVLIRVQEELIDVTRGVLDDLDWIIEQLSIEHYNLNVPLIHEMRSQIRELLGNMEVLLTFINDLDLEIYSIEDIGRIVEMINTYGHLTESLKGLIQSIRENVKEFNIYEIKRADLNQAHEIAKTLRAQLDVIMNVMEEFDIQIFMRTVNDLRSYLDHAKTNPEDISIIGQINEFDDHWSIQVKEYRKVFFISSALLNNTFDPKKSYTDDEVLEFVDLIKIVRQDLLNLQEVTYGFWKNRELPVDQPLIDRYDNALTQINGFLDNMLRYFDLRNKLKETIDEIKSILTHIDRFIPSDREKLSQSEIFKNLDQMLSAVSYIVGVQQRVEASESLEWAYLYFGEWFDYIDHEEQVFLRLLKISEGDGEFLRITQEAWIWFRGVLQYLKTVTERFTPDTKWPTYAEVFEITKIEIFNGGFRHQVGDTIFIQHLGTYKVIAVGEDISTIQLIESDTRRRTNFRDPMSQLRPYDSITDGNGLGFMVKAIESSRTPIINDTVILPFISRMEKLLERIVPFLKTPNPFNNREFKIVIESIPRILEDWSQIVRTYSEYMTNETRLRMTSIITNIQTLITPSHAFIEERSKIDISDLAKDWDKLIVDVAQYASEIGWVEEDFFFRDAQIRAQYHVLMGFLGTGTTWDNSERLIEIIADSRQALWIYNKYIFPRFDTEEETVIEFKEIVTRLERRLIHMKTDLLGLEIFTKPISELIDSLKESLTLINPEELHKDLWYRIHQARVAIAGEGYAVGDIVALVPELPTDENGRNYWEVTQFLFDREVIPHTGTAANRAVIGIKIVEEELITQDDILVRIMRVDEEGRVIEVEMFMDYALPYPIHGIRETKTLMGNGIGLIVDIFGNELTLKDNTVINGEDLFTPPTNQFNENDLFTFKFENTHDLNMNYEVFLGGKQVQHFIQRHQQRLEIDENRYHPNKIDVIYLKANDVMGLAGSAIFFPAENYFVYRVNKIEIKDPGAGYAVGQDIFVDTGSFALRLKVAKLLNEPFKGIDSLEVISGNKIFDDTDPSVIGGRVATDSLNNIDDEFNVGYYDQIPKEGIKKAATLSYPIEEYSFIAKRFDEMDGDDRNARFMYPFVQKPITDPPVSDGDPDYYWYAGNRIDNSQDPRDIFGQEWSVAKFDPIINVDKINWVLKSFKPDEDPKTVIDALSANTLPWQGGVIGFDIGLAYKLITTDTPGYEHMKERWNGIYELQPPTDPFIPTSLRLPPNISPQGEFQRFEWVRFHNTPFEQEVHSKGINPENPEGEGNGVWIDFNLDAGITQPSDEKIGVFIPISPGRNVRIDYDLKVATYNDIPKHIHDWANAGVGKWVLVEEDETNDGRRMMYRLRTFTATGFFVYNWPLIADEEWNHIDINWMNIDWYPDPPQLSQLYPTAPWRTAKTFRQIEEEISDGRHDPLTPPQHMNKTSYIHNITVDDLSVFNWTTKEWEDLQDTTKWRLDVRNDPENKDWGFRLTCLSKETYSHDFRLYWNKIPSTQKKNATLKRNAVLDIFSVISDEIRNPARNISVNTLRHVRIRKLFPYEQKETFIIGYDEDNNPLGYEMDFKVANYMHFKNQLHLQDIKVYNKTAGRFEDVLDQKLYEVRFKDPKATARGFETQTRIVQSIIARAGENFINGQVWGWNETLGVHLFGEITATVGGIGHMLTFTPLHCPNPPDENISLEFQIYQTESQTPVQMGVVLVEFKTETVEMFGDGYIHNVINPLAPIPSEFKVIPQYNLNGSYEYDIIISKTAKKHTFIDPSWILTPTIKIPGESLSHNTIYMMTEKGRFPLVNPSTGIPSFYTRHTDEGTEVVFLNLYRRYEHLEVRTVPYPMRSVYVQRRIPQHGFIDLAGKLNKPLNKKYFEFWMNGRLLHDEVTIISPTKLVMHGLRSLRNFEIIEVNRDPNEYFSDIFLEKSVNSHNRPTYSWNYKTYLDGAIDGTLDGDNYTPEEQRYLLSPVWPQVPEDHPSYKDYPPNMDLDDDVILRVEIPNDLPIYDVDDTSSQFMLIDLPSLEGKQFAGRMRFDHFGFRPLTNEMIIDMLNEEWAEEIANDPYMFRHVIISDDEWYGTTARLYDEFGILVHNLNEAAYKVPDWKVININSQQRTSRIIDNSKTFDLN